MHRRVYDILGLSPCKVRLSRHDLATDTKQKFIGDATVWQWAEQTLRDVLVASGLPFEEGPGEAAFYGPKIDFQFRSVTGREETASTLQLDFVMPQRLDLTYVGKSGGEHRPFVLHRAPLGTHERFVALLIERYAGAFPTWLAPVQVRVLPVSAPFADYGTEIVTLLRQRRIRAEIDAADDALGKKIRQATLRKIPNLLVIGQRERAHRTVTVRRYGVEAQRSMALDVFIDETARAVEERHPHTAAT
jgi:threonyl-tRNA synthetase